MNRSRHLATFLLLLGLFALAAPALALAGGSAGDQQYVDPLAAGQKHQSSTSPASITPAPRAPTSTTSAPSPSPTPSSSPASSSGVTTSAVAPTATIASAPSSTVTTSAQATKQLPYTGYDSWLAGGLGGLLVIGGLGLRWTARRA